MPSCLSAKAYPFLSGSCGALMLPWVPTRVRKQIVGNGGRRIEAKLLAILIVVFEVQVWRRAVWFIYFSENSF